MTDFWIIYRCRTNIFYLLTSYKFFLFTKQSCHFEGPNIAFCQVNSGNSRNQKAVAYYREGPAYKRANPPLLNFHPFESDSRACYIVHRVITLAMSTPLLIRKRCIHAHIFFSIKIQI